MKKSHILVIFALSAILVLACGGGAIATSAPQTEAPVATEAPATEAPATEAPATEAPATEAAPAFVEYSDESGYVSAEVPGDWLYEQNTDTNIYADNFYPEEGGAFIQSIVYDDGTTWNQKIAGQVALYVLNQGYTNGAGDIKISKDEPMPDGSEQLTWSSAAGNYSGITVFKSTGKKLILFSVLYHNDAEAVYKDTLDHVLSTLEFTQ